MNNDVKEIAGEAAARCFQEHLRGNRLSNVDLFANHIELAINKALEQERVGNICIHHNDTERAGITKECRICLQIERDSLQQKLARAIEDRARFPDKPDDIGRMIECHVANLKSAAEKSEEAWRWENTRANVAEQKLEQAEKENLRLFDLVRYQRAELHQAELISDNEYTWLCSTDPRSNESRKRLESYDALRSKLQTAVEALEFYANGWFENADGDLMEAHLTRTWLEPTEALIEDKGQLAKDALSTLSDEKNNEPKTT